MQPEFEGPDHGVLTMGYYERSDLPFYYALADAFTICDNYHCSVLGPTHPNRLMSLSGTVDPTGHAGGPGADHQPTPDAIYSVSWDTMPEVLEDAGISWKVYNPHGRDLAPAFFEKHGFLVRRHPPLLLAVQEPELRARPEGVPAAVPGRLRVRHASGQLPAVSWIIPPAGYDEHPSSPPALGEWFTSQLLAR